MTDRPFDAESPRIVSADAEPVAVLIVAGGRGVRAGGGVPKQYRALGGRTVLRRTVARFLGHPGVARVQVAIHADDRALYDAAVGDLALAPPVIGGASRQETVRLGLEALAADGAETVVLVHDAARPFVPAELIDRVIAASVADGAAVPALPVSDTLKRADGAGRVVGTESRDGLYGAQTPQGFRLAPLIAAHRAAAAQHLEATDDAAVMEAAGHPVTLVGGDAQNVKLTSAADFARAEAWLTAHRETRVGTGFDVHRFAPGDRVTLCGVAIPHDRGLAGHSDADVGLHALTDAVLGAVGAGDIGDHFPPSDPRWKGADSAAFLRHALDLAAERGGVPVHLDVTLIAQAPKIGPHRAAMRTRIAEIAGLAPERVSVKATTTEGLGFTGRGEGIAAQAAVTLAIEREALDAAHETPGGSNG